jgi:hypothetical protein
MKTAKELRELADNSESRIKKILDELEAKMVERAEKGFVNLECNFSIFGIPFFESESVRYVPEPNPTAALVMDRLRKLGYEVSWRNIHADYVPRGLMNDFEEGPKFQTWIWVISW